MRYPVSEALDKYSILWLKDFFGCDVAKELGQFENYLRDQFGAEWKQMEASVRLGLCNALQWMLEERINPFGEDADVLEATFRIRRSNVQRSAAKNVLTGIYGGFVDQRVRYPGGEVLTREDREFKRRVRSTPRLIEEAEAERARQAAQDPAFCEWMRQGQRRCDGETFEGLSRLIEPETDLSSRPSLSVLPVCLDKLPCRFKQPAPVTEQPEPSDCSECCPESAEGVVLTADGPCCSIPEQPVPTESTPITKSWS